MKSYTVGHGYGAKTTFSDSKFANDIMTYLFVYYDSKGIRGIMARYKKGGLGTLHGYRGTETKTAYIYVNGNTRDAITRVTGTSGTIVDSLKVYRKNYGGTSSYGNPSGGKGFDTSSATSKVCETGWKHFEGKCYKYVNTMTTWEGAKSTCSKMGGELAVPSTSSKNKFISTQFSSSQLWIGGFKNKGKWQWVDGSVWSYSSWATNPKEPSGDGPVMVTNFNGRGLWNDRPDKIYSGSTLLTKYNRAFVCQAPMKENCRLSYLSGNTKTWSSKTYIGSLKFTYVCCYKAEISFKVRAKSDAHVLLSQYSGGDGHEIVIGGWSNTQSAIRDSKQKPHPGYAVTKTSNYLSSSYYRGFWINLKDDGMKLYVSVGRLYYSSPFMSYALNYKHSINWIGFAAWEKNYGYFIYENKSYAPYGYKYSYIRASNLLM